MKRCEENVNHETKNVWFVKFTIKPWLLLCHGKKWKPQEIANFWKKCPVKGRRAHCGSLNSDKEQLYTCISVLSTFLISL